MPISVTLAALTILWAGCQNPQDTTSGSHESAKQVLAGPAGPEIVQRVLEAYRKTDRYQDEATLRLSYQLLGKHLEEPHEWQIRFLRNQGLTADIFETRIRADDQRLTCFVFDFASGNLDNQWQVHPRGDSLPLPLLFQDGICRHYITGHEDLPIHPSQPLAAEAFFPPTIGLLTGQTKVAWLEEGIAERLSDKTINGEDCFRVRITHSDITWTMLVDKYDWLIREIRYPTELLDGRLQDNPDVQYLEVVAEFRVATFQPRFSDTAFQLEIPPDARLVRHFVAVPEAFPSSHIGKKIPDLGLHDSRDLPINQKDWEGKTILLCWTNGAVDQPELLARLETLRNSLTPGRFSVARVEIITDSLPGNAQVAKRLTRMEKETIPTLADYAFASGRTIGLDHYPMLAIIDQQGVLQYVRSMQGELINPDELATVLHRVRSGDDVAAEMRQEYESFLDLYRERLTEAKFSDGAEGVAVAESGPTHLKAQRQWINEDVLQPGNMQIRSAGQLTLLDGWRTVIQMDLAGHKTASKELDLDEQESISIVRPGDQQKNLSVVFSIMGRTARVLDEKLTPVQTVEVSNEQQRIRDANLFDFDNDGRDELMVSFTGPRGTEIIESDPAGQSRRISNQSFRSATVIRRSNDQKSLLFCDANAKLRVIDSGDKDARGIACDLAAATRVVARQDDQQLVICAIGTDSQGQWTAIGLDEDLNQIWSEPIGSQRFETQIDSVTWACAANQRHGMWVIASTDGSLKIIRDDGKLVDEWKFGVPLRGLQLTPAGNQYLLVISTDNDVQGWSLSTGSGGTIRASSRQ